MRAWIAALSAGALLSAPAAARQDFDQGAALAASQAVIGHQIGDYRLRDAEGKNLRLSTLRGKPLVVNFVYTGCFQVCPTATRALESAVGDAQRELGADAFRVATIGFNLPFDTPEAMKDFARRQGVQDPNWIFLSPEADSLRGLVADFGFRYQATAAGFDHLLQVTIVDAQGRVYRQLYGNVSGAQLAAPLRALLKSEPELPVQTSLLDKLRLVCSVYDPATGAYVFNAAYFVEMIIGTVIIALGIAVVVIEWRRRHGPRPTPSG